MAGRGGIAGTPSNFTLNSQEGADRAIGDGTKLCLPAKIAEIHEARQRLEQSRSAEERGALVGFVASRYGALVNIGEYASISALARVPKSEIEALFLEAQRVFGRLQFDPKWTMTGILMNHDMALLSCLSGFLRWKENVKLFIDLKVLTALASFCASRSGIQMPGQQVAQVVSWLVHRICGSLLKDLGLQFAQIFFLLEGSRMLAQMLRLATVPYDQKMTTQVHVVLLDALVNCPAIVRRRLVPGTPTGEVLQNILKRPRMDGYVGERPHDPTIESRLQQLHKMALVPDAVGENNGPRRVCGHCRSSEKNDKLLAACSRCKSVYYCCSECQKADWPKHRSVCKPKQQIEAEVEGDNAFSKNAIFQLLQSSYYHVMIKIHDMVKTTGKQKKELLLEADFKADQSGTAPALRNPPEYRIVPITGYIQGVNLPEWYDEAPQGVIGAFMQHVKNVSAILTDDELLTVMRGPSGHPSMFRFAARLPQTQKHIFSIEAFDLVGRFRDRKADETALQTVFDEAMINNMFVLRDRDHRAPNSETAAPKDSPNVPNMEEVNRMMSELKTVEEDKKKEEEEEGFQECVAYN